MQKALPSPVITPTNRLSSWSNASQISAISRLVALSTQLSLSVLVSVTWTTFSWGKVTRKCSNFNGRDRKETVCRGLSEACCGPGEGFAA